ncbi:hypothetical protein ABT072_18265 [Streptomyces sp. NPDC002589]|uniref:hypothetical protein n=1 Tax=Streptomyces sp. NPDC002589 TaxID=3154420 RepID=UPI0033197309
MGLDRTRKLCPLAVGIRRFIDYPPRCAISFARRMDDPSPVLTRFAAYVTRPE